MLQQCDEVVTVELAIAEDGCQQARSDNFPGMDRDDCSSAIAVTEELVTALDSHNFEPYLPQRGDNFAAGNPRQARHVTEIR